MAALGPIWLVWWQLAQQDLCYCNVFFPEIGGDSSMDSGPGTAGGPAHRMTAMGFANKPGAGFMFDSNGSPSRLISIRLGSLDLYFRD